MLNDSFVQRYQSVAWQDDCADVIVHSSKFSPQRYVRYYDKADNIILSCTTHIKLELADDSKEREREREKE